VGGAELPQQPMTIAQPFAWLLQHRLCLLPHDFAQQVRR
jgi:hypothetical protein